METYEQLKDLLFKTLRNAMLITIAVIVLLLILGILFFWLEWRSEPWRNTSLRIRSLLTI